MAQSGSLLGGLIKLAVIAAALYFAYTQILPLVQDNLRFGGEASQRSSLDHGSDGGEDDGLRCVRRAESANNRLGDYLSLFRRPPFDQERWQTVVENVEDGIRTAEVSCDCPLRSCDKAMEALANLSSVLADLDAQITGSATSVRNPARRQERVNDLLDEAKALARRGG